MIKNEELLKMALQSDVDYITTVEPLFQAIMPENMIERARAKALTQLHQITIECLVEKALGIENVEVLSAEAKNDRFIITFKNENKTQTYKFRPGFLIEHFRES